MWSQIWLNGFLPSNKNHYFWTHFHFVVNSQTMQWILIWDNSWISYLYKSSAWCQCDFLEFWLLIINAFKIALSYTLGGLQYFLHYACLHKSYSLILVIHSKTICKWTKFPFWRYQKEVTFTSLLLQLHVKTARDRGLTLPLRRSNIIKALSEAKLGQKLFWTKENFFLLPPELEKVPSNLISTWII